MARCCIVDRTSIRAYWSDSNIACAGQKEAAPLGYSPLSPNLVKDVFAAVRRIPGAPAPPPLTASACPNPTITGQGYGGSPGDNNPTSGPPAGGSGTTATTQSGNGGGNQPTKAAKTSKTSQPIDPATAAALGQTSALTVTPLTVGQRRAAYVAALSAAKQLEADSAPSTLLTAAVLALLLLGPLAFAARRRPSPDGADV